MNSATPPAEREKLRAVTQNGSLEMKYLTIVALALLSACVGTAPTRERYAGYSSLSVVQEPSAEGGRPEGRPEAWRLGAPFYDPETSGYTLVPFFERTQLEVKGLSDGGGLPAFRDGDVEFQFSGLRVGRFFENLHVEAFLAVADLTDDADPELMTTEGVVAGISASGLMRRWGSLGLLGQAGFSAGEADLEVSGQATTAIKWAQTDLRTALAFIPSPNAVFAVAPSGGVGLRIFDGIQNLGGLNQDTAITLDESAVYGFLGVSLDWSPRPGLMVGTHLEWMVGELQGIKLELVISL